MPFPQRPMLDRLQRKLAEICRYPALAHKPADRRDLRALGLWRTRVLSAAMASRLTGRGEAVITPGLQATAGQPVRVTIGDYSELDCFDEIFVERIYALERVPFRPDLVVDCGGFRGYFCALARGAFPQARVVCIEPNPRHQPALAAQLALLSAPVERLEVAVGTQDGVGAFAGDGMGGALVASGSGQSVPVRILDFARWLAACRATALVWKLDIEGGEAEILPAALAHLPARTALFLETHYPRSRCEELIAPYAAAGFVVHEVRRREQGGRTYIEWLLLRSPSA
ncbi:MAG: FkbM family methyltransferase [Opitutaceae bacterium]|nr:FkbM family methyltransferase [Opitutaceae bacterium]